MGRGGDRVLDEALTSLLPTAAEVSINMIPVHHTVQDWEWDR